LKRIRVLLLTQWFDPEPTFKGIIFAKELVRQGFYVEVVTGFPNYPGGKLYPGYKIQWLTKEFHEGFEITRVPLYPSHDQSSLKRILNYVSFAFSSLLYSLFVAKRPDVIYSYHPPLTVGITASLIRLFRRIPVVYDIQDMWPDTLRATGMIRSTRSLKLVELLCQWVYRRVDHIVVLSSGFKRLLMERGVPESKLTVIYNWADEQSLVSSVVSLPDHFPGADRFKILFAGNIGKAQSLDAVLDAVSSLKLEKSNITWIFLGGGVEVSRLKSEAEHRELDNVIFLPQVSMSEVGAYLDAADALLVHLRKDPLFQVTIPSKTQAYMAVGKPLLMAVEGDAAELVQKAEAGLIAIPEDSKSIARAALDLEAMSKKDRQIMASNGKMFYEQYLSLKVGAQSFGILFDRFGK